MTFSSDHPRAARSSATLLASSEVHRALGLRGVRCSSAQQCAEPTSMAVYCHTAPLAPDSRPMKKQMLLCSVNQASVDLPGDEALEAADGLCLAQPIMAAPSHVGLRAIIPAQSNHH